MKPLFLFFFVGLSSLITSSCLPGNNRREEQTAQWKAETSRMLKELAANKNENAFVKLPTDWRDQLIQCQSDRLKLDDQIKMNQEEIAELKSVCDQYSSRLEEYKSSNPIND